MEIRKVVRGRRLERRREKKRKRRNGETENGEKGRLEEGERKRGRVEGQGRSVQEYEVEPSCHPILGFTCGSYVIWIYDRQ
jgi:hypothetical protein